MQDISDFSENDYSLGTIYAFLLVGLNRLITFCYYHLLLSHCESQRLPVAILKEIRRPSSDLGDAETAEGLKAQRML